VTDPRLVFVDATLALLDAAIAGTFRLGPLLGAAVAEGWEGFPEALPSLRSAYARAAAGPNVGHDWGAVLFVLESPRTLVGLGGFKGVPRDGIVEIGYAIAPAFQGRGLATAAAAHLLCRAFASALVDAVDAHTLPHLNPSTRVLEKLNFRRMGEIVDPDDGPIWHWRRERGLQIEHDVAGGA
jgi:ribosomal-protein-alanine N-acetyltransferase